MSEIPEMADDYRPDKFSLSNSEVRSTGIMCGGAVLNIAREVLALRAKVAALEAENGRLKAPVSGEELVLLLGNGSTREQMATASWCRHFYDALIAARAKEPTP